MSYPHALFVRSACRCRRRTTGWSALHACLAASLGCGPSLLGVVRRHFAPPWHSQRASSRFSRIRRCMMSCLGRHASLLAVVGSVVCIWRWKPDFRGHLLLRFPYLRLQIYWVSIWQWKRDFRGHLLHGGGSLTSAVILSVSSTPGLPSQVFSL